jgi:hypothetical protein
MKGARFINEDGQEATASCPTKRPISILGALRPKPIKEAIVMPSECERKERPAGSRPASAFAKGAPILEWPCGECEYYERWCRNNPGFCGHLYDYLIKYAYWEGFDRGFSQAKGIELKRDEELSCLITGLYGGGFSHG